MNDRTLWDNPEREINDSLFALEFLSDTPSVILSGGRRGILNITDLRVTRARPDAIIHPSTITHIKQVDTHHILVNGLNSSLRQYDLRFRKEDTIEKNFMTTTRVNGRNIHSTRPILQYPDFQNTATWQIGFDVDLEAGVIAAAQEPDEFHDHVQLFSLHGGHKLHPLDRIDGSLAIEGQVVKCLRFAQEGPGKMKSLYVGYGFDVQRYAWDDKYL